MAFFEGLVTAQRWGGPQSMSFIEIPWCHKYLSFIQLSNYAVHFPVLRTKCTLAFFSPRTILKMKDAFLQISVASSLLCIFLEITLLSFRPIIKYASLPVKCAKVQHFSLCSLLKHMDRYFSHCYVMWVFFFWGHKWAPADTHALLLLLRIRFSALPTAVTSLLSWTWHTRIPLVRGLQIQTPNVRSLP